MSNTADIVVIGGGVIGLASAFYIARDVLGASSQQRIVIIEKEPVIGAGATGKNAGGIRAQFSTGVNINFSLKSIEIFERFAEETGRQLEFNQCGYLFLQTTAEQVRDFERQAELQRSLGVVVDFLDPKDIVRLAPLVRVDDVLRGSFSPRDGVADPGDIAMGYYEAARRLGVEVLTSQTVTGLEMAGDTITGVKTDKGLIQTRMVINAAGPYAAKIAAMAGYRAPIEPIKRQIVVTGPLENLAEDFPMVVDVSSGLYFHRETPGLLLGWAKPDTAAGFDESADPDYTDEILMHALDRMPDLEEASVGSVWAGLYETTPDHHAIIGQAPGVSGMIMVNGFSGHGLMHAPAAGMVVADLVAGVTPRLETEELSPERFNRKDALIHETNVI